MKNIFKTLLVLALALILVFTLIACGGDDDTQSGDSGSTDTTETSAETTTEGSTETPIESQSDNNSSIELPIVP